MITLNLENNKYKLPESFYEMTFEQYEKIQFLDHTEDFIKYRINIIHALTGIPKDDLLRIKISDLDQVLSKLNYLLDDTSLKYLNEIEIEGKKYKFCENFKNENFAFLMDMETWTKDETSVKNNLSYIMASIYRPIENGNIKNYEFNNIKELHERVDLFKKHMKAIHILSAMFFFTGLKIKSLEKIKDYILVEMKSRYKKKDYQKVMNLLKTNKNYSVKNGVGSN
jgi:hypothetical protein